MSRVGRKSSQGLGSGNSTESWGAEEKRGRRGWGQAEGRKEEGRGPGFLTHPNTRCPSHVTLGTGAWAPTPAQQEPETHLSWLHSTLSFFLV